MRLASRFLVVSLTALALTSCALLTEPFGEDAPDVRGTWTLSGVQSSPSLEFTGSLVITAQRGGEINGTANWVETDGVSAPRLDGGPMNGRVLSPEDLDFDITLLSGERRMVGRLLADTLSGSWVQPSVSRSGTFRAVRSSVP
jgi:hypothetical protein